MRVLILPGGNALSHLAKGLAVRDALRARGHEVAVAATAARAPVLSALGIPHHVLPDLQDADQGHAPAYAWFRNPGHVQRVVEAERALIAATRPDRVLGVFRFTATTAAALEGTPCDTLACGCMVPAFRGVLGFRPGEEGWDAQRQFLDAFYRRCADRLRPVLARSSPPLVDLRSLLLGERTFLWDTPAFEPLAREDLAPGTGLIHVGPPVFEGWPADPGGAEALDRLGSPLAILSMGTALPPDSAPDRILKRLLALGFHVAIAGGGRPVAVPPHPRVTVFRFAPMARLLDRAALLVCHGGQQSVFEAMARRVPVAVLPFHPEQAQNGLCLERLGAGGRLVPATVFWGAGAVYLEALGQLDDAALDARLAAIARLPVPEHPFPTPAAAERIAELLEA